MVIINQTADLRGYFHIPDYVQGYPSSLCIHNQLHDRSRIPITEHLNIKCSVL